MAGNLKIAKNKIKMNEKLKLMKKIKNTNPIWR
jgi:hypothetical protein